MNDIRVNKDEETVIVEGKFTFSLGAALPWIIIGIILLSLYISFMRMGSDPNTNIPEGGKMFLRILAGVFLFALIAYSAYQICRIIAIKKNKLTVTNKRIYGLRHMLVSKKDYSYRLDMIDDVEMHSSFGKHTVCIRFTQGNMNLDNNSSLVIAYLKNYQEINDALNKLITDKKNIVDLKADVEMSKIDVENKKAQALENIGNNMAAGSTASSNKSDYIEELKKLKELYDQGIITKEEFEQEKKEILNNNHK